MILGDIVGFFNLTKNIFDDYELYKEKSLSKRRFKHSDILPLLQRLNHLKEFRIKTIGKSLEGRDIFLVSIGSGTTRILSWSQMHGDEATATMALFDLFNFFSASDKYDEYRNSLLKEVTLHFIPMLNPDGAEKFQRENALQIDINRDALTLISPESKILMSQHDELMPQFGFNLHDQNSGYRVGYSGKQAAISFVAPPFDFQKSMSGTRANSMKVIVDLYSELSKFIPGHLSRYSDEFEPRSFGDNFTNSNTSSILIESGAWFDDQEKQFLRQINFVALLTGFSSIAERQYEMNKEADYFSIPENKELMFSYLLKNVNLPFEGKDYKVDIGINHEEISTKDRADFYKVGTIEEIGDLSTYSSTNTIDCSGMTLHEGKTYPHHFDSINELNNLNFEELFQQNFLSVVLKDISVKNNFTNLPINILLDSNSIDYSVLLKNKANFLLKKGNSTKLVVMNGFVFAPASDETPNLNGLIINQTK